MRRQTGNYTAEILFVICLLFRGARSLAYINHYKIPDHSIDDHGQYGTSERTSCDLATDENSGSEQQITCDEGHHVGMDVTEGDGGYSDGLNCAEQYPLSC